MLNRLLLCLLGLCALFAHLSYQFYGDKREAEQALASALQTISDSEKSKQTSIFSCEITDSILSEWQVALQESNAKTGNVVSSIEKLPLRVASPSGTSHDKTNDVVDIDGKLPPELASLLSKASRGQGGSIEIDAR